MQQQMTLDDSADGVRVCRTVRAGGRRGAAQRLAALEALHQWPGRASLVQGVAMGDTIISTENDSNDSKRDYCANP
jgi:hypothetical protein